MLEECHLTVSLDEAFKGFSHQLIAAVPEKP